VQNITSATTAANVEAALESNGYTVISSDTYGGISLIYATKTIDGKAYFFQASNYPGFTENDLKEMLALSVPNFSGMGQFTWTLGGYTNVVNNPTSVSYTYGGADYFYAIQGTWIVSSTPAQF
jgi:hypothetical protein